MRLQKNFEDDSPRNLRDIANFRWGYLRKYKDLLKINVFETPEFCRQVFFVLAMFEHGTGINIYWRDSRKFLKMIVQGNSEMSPILVEDIFENTKICSKSTYTRLREFCSQVFFVLAMFEHSTGINIDWRDSRKILKMIGQGTWEISPILDKRRFLQVATEFHIQCSYTTNTVWVRFGNCQQNKENLSAELRSLGHIEFKQILVFSKKSSSKIGDISQVPCPITFNFFLDSLQ